LEGASVTTLDTVERIVCRERGEDAVRVIEGVLEILNQLGFGFRRIVTTLFAVFGRFLVLKFIEEGELGAGDVLHLFLEYFSTAKTSFHVTNNLDPRNRT
jgi:hypothetical protein